MRILMVSSVSDLRGGAERSLVELAQGLHDRGHAVFLAVWQRGELASAFQSIGEIFVLGADRDPASPFGGATNRLPVLSPLIGLLNRGRLWVRSTRREGVWLEDCIRRAGVDLIHSNCDQSPIAAERAARAAGVPWIAHVRDQCRNWLHPRTARALRSAEAVVATSSFLAGRFRAAGIHTIVIPNPVAGGPFRRSIDPDARNRIRSELGLGSTKDVFAVAVVGRLDEQKGSLRIITLARWLAENGETHDRPVRFLMAGGGAHAFEERMRHAIGRRDLTDRIFLLGHRDDVTRWLPAMDALVVPASGEAFGRMIVEGMHAALPVLTFDDGAAGEILDDGRTGMLVPEGDIPALGSALQQLANDPDLRAHLGEMARTSARRFEPSIVIREVEAVYRMLIEG